jgi:hypothetical protein
MSCPLIHQLETSGHAQPHQGSAEKQSADLSGSVQPTLKVATWIPYFDLFYLLVRFGIFEEIPVGRLRYAQWSEFYSS